jgi:hypothetical protein
MRLGINKVAVSVEHQQSNVLVENMNKMIKIELRVHVEKNLKTWDAYLPFEAMYSRKARVPAMNQVSCFAGKHYNAQQWASYSKHFIPILHNKIKVNIQENQERQKKSTMITGKIT